MTKTLEYIDGKEITRDMTPEEEAEHAAQSVIDLPSARDSVWEKIKVERDGPRTEGGAKVGSYWFHTDTSSRIKWLGLKDTARDILAAGGTSADQIYEDGEAVLWKTMGGTFVPVTVQLALDVVAAVKVLDKRLFKNAEQHNALMRAAANPLAYDYSTGWPESYQPGA